MMERKSLVELREEMRAVARGDRQAPPRPAPTTLRSALTEEALEMLNIIATTTANTVTGFRSVWVKHSRTCRVTVNGSRRMASRDWCARAAKFVRNSFLRSANQWWLAESRYGANCDVVT